MELNYLIAGVFAGNLLTAIVVWSAVKLDRAKSVNDVSWNTFMGMLLPLAFLAIVFLIDQHDDEPVEVQTSYIAD